MDQKRENILIKSVVSAITISIIILLFLSEPAGAYFMSLTTSNNHVNRGSKIKFSASLKIVDSELFDINYLILKLNSSDTLTNINCKFLPNGTIIEDCLGIKITVVSLAPYISDYGYPGYVAGTMKYNIVLDTKNYAAGKYNTYLAFVVGSKTFEEFQGIVNISRGIGDSCYLTPGIFLTGTNIRGEDGTLTIEGKVLGNDKLSLSLHSKSKLGEGSITAQQDRKRFSYSFKVTQIEDTRDKAYIYVTGEYKLGTKEKIPLSTILEIDKKNSQAGFTQGAISLKNMPLIFNGKGCE